MTQFEAFDYQRQGERPSGSIPRFVLLTCVFQRPALTKMVLGAYEAMRRDLLGEVDLQLLAVGSEGTYSRDLCTERGFNYVEFENSPLSFKWNAGVRAAREYDPDGLVIVGSDELVSARLFTVYSRKLTAGLDFFGLQDLYFYHVASGTLGYWPGYGATALERMGEPIGCGRCFSRRLLNATDWNLWPGGQGYDSLLDDVTLALLQGRGFQPRSWTMDSLGVRAVDIKNGLNITPFHSYRLERSWTGASTRAFLREWFTRRELQAAGLLSNESVVP